MGVSCINRAARSTSVCETMSHAAAGPTPAAMLVVLVSLLVGFEQCMLLGWPLACLLCLLGGYVFGVGSNVGSSVGSSDQMNGPACLLEHSCVRLPSGHGFPRDQLDRKWLEAWAFPCPCAQQMLGTATTFHTFRAARTIRQPQATHCRLWGARGNA